MKTAERKPQMAQMYADVISSASICENLRHLRSINSLALETDKALNVTLEKLGV